MTSDNADREPGSPGGRVPRVANALGKIAKAAKPVDLPAPRLVELPDRGRTCVIDAPGPEGAPTVILLHALATTAALSWYPSIEALTQHYRVIAFDQRWHGRGIQSEHFRIPDCADDVVAVADACRVDKFMLVGYSMGGAVAQMTWKRHRERVEGLVLAATARNFRGKMTERLWFSLTAAAMNRWGVRARTGMLKVAGALSDQPSGLSAAADRIAPWAMTEFRSTSAWSIFAALDEIGKFDSATWINRVDVPTSVIVATRDRFIPTRRQRRLAASIPGAMTYDVEGNHAAIVLGAEEFVPVLIAACRSVTRRLERRPAA
ncbi:MAG TPA: alpha/beta hydrolase [Mycobacteriales bacterium]|jgi:pimeloyl-ACP methyl ester carboxylesterase|nr:alpha/beta hydrolase [Mycobacteriales bacterium]